MTFKISNCLKNVYPIFPHLSTSSVLTETLGFNQSGLPEACNRFYFSFKIKI